MPRRRIRASLPLTKGGDGRDRRTGQFTTGWRGGPGNPFAKRVGALRSALYDEVTADDIRHVVRKMIEMAAAGDVAAAKVVLERCFGTVKAGAVQLVLEARSLKDLIEDEEDEASEEADAAAEWAALRRRA